MIRGGIALVVTDKLCDADFRFAEKLLYEYVTHDTAIAELQAELDSMIPDYSRSVVKFDHNTKNTHGESEPEKWAIKRNESIRGKYLQNRIAERKRHQKAIREARQSLNDTESQLVWLFYDLRKTARESWRTMHIEKSRFYEMRQEVVNKVAQFIGLI